MNGIALAAALAAASPAGPVPEGTILVGRVGYGDSPEFAEMMETDGGNLWAQWEKSEKLLPEYFGEKWSAWARTNRTYLISVYGRQDGALTKRLRESWGDLYLGNNIGEYAGFMYQDEKSRHKGWPECNDLKEARDWFAKEMMAGPKRSQASRPEDEREPWLFSTSGSPLACYEYEGGIDWVCNEMYAVGCGNLAYATAEARGAAKRKGLGWWSAWLAHEWQTCWPRLPYATAQKMDSLEVGLKELWVMGTSMMVLESGSQTTQAHDYTPPDGTMKEFKSKKQEFGDPVPRAYRKTMGDFYRWTKSHPRAKGAPVVDAALVLGNCDGFVGMAYDTFAIFGQHHLAATNANWRCGAPEFTWEAMEEEFFPRPADSLRPFANGWIGGTPHGQVDVVSVDDEATAATLSPYKAVVFGGWNTMTEKIASVLREYVAAGGEVVLCAAQLSSRTDREYSNYTAGDLVQAVPGVEVGDPFASEDVLILSETAPDFLRKAFPAHLSVKMRLASATVGDGAEVVASMGKKPYLVKARHGKGAFWLALSWDYPAARRERDDFPSFRNFRLDFHLALAAGVVESKASRRVLGEDAKYINWAQYPDGTVYMLNTDCVSRRSVEFGGRRFSFEPKELKEVK